MINDDLIIPDIESMGDDDWQNELNAIIEMQNTTEFELKAIKNHKRRLKRMIEAKDKLREWEDIQKEGRSM